MSPQTAIGNETLSMHARMSVHLMGSGETGLTRGEIHFSLDSDAFDRARVVGHYLSASLILCEQMMYPEALALCRSALEAAVCDLLSLRHDRMVFYRRFESREVASRWLENTFASRSIDSELEDATLHAECRQAGCVEFVQRSKMTLGDGSVQSLPGVRLLALEHFQPFARRRENFRSARYPSADQEGSVQEARRFYNHQVTFPAVRRQLVRLGAMQPDEAEQLQHHFDYLSLYVHPQVDPHELFWPLDHRMGIRRDTWVERLILLYIAVIADLELESLIAYIASRDEIGHLDLEQWGSDAARLRRTLDVRTELRMPWAPSHFYDDYTEHAWSRIHANDIASTDGKRRFADDVRPHLGPDVLSRVVALHHAENEWAAAHTYLPASSSVTDY